MYKAKFSFSTSQNHTKNTYYNKNKKYMNVCEKTHHLSIYHLFPLSSSTQIKQVTVDHVLRRRRIIRL